MIRPSLHADGTPVFEAEGGEWLAPMVWGSAVYHLPPRDECIGWNMALRAAPKLQNIQTKDFLCAFVPLC